MENAVPAGGDNLGGLPICVLCKMNGGSDAPKMDFGLSIAVGLPLGRVCQSALDTKEAVKAAGCTKFESCHRENTDSRLRADVFQTE